MLISKFNPIIISVDTNKVPKTVKRISRLLNLKLIKPRKDLRIIRKEFLARKSLLPYKNKHERDAIAAALYGYKRIKKLINKIKKYDVNLEKAIRLILIEKEKSVKHAVQKLHQTN